MEPARQTGSRLLSSKPDKGELTIADWSEFYRHLWDYAGNRSELNLAEAQEALIPDFTRGPTAKILREKIARQTPSKL